MNKTTVDSLSSVYSYNNLTNTPFLNNCILYAPNGVMTQNSDGTLTVHKGLTILCTNGKNPDGTYKSTLYTVPNDIISNQISHTGYNWPIFIILMEGGYLKLPAISDFAVLDSIPSSTHSTYCVVYNYKENMFYETNDSGANWQPAKCCIIGHSTFVDGKFSNTRSLAPVNLGLQGLGDYVVEQYYLSNTNWFRRWKSGFIEQGFQTGKVGDYSTYTANLITPFPRNTYTVSFSNWRSGTGEDGQWNSAAVCNLGTKTSSSFQIYNRGAADGGRIFSVYCCGY